MPYLMGERSPYNNPDARAAFIGMSMDSTRTDMLQAVMEGICFGIRDSYEVAKALGTGVKRTRICGGGSKGELAKKMMADILNTIHDNLFLYYYFNCSGLSRNIAEFAT